MALPPEVAARSEAEWTKLVNSGELEDRQAVQGILKALFPTDKSVYLGKPPEVKLSLILAAQGQKAAAAPTKTVAAKPASAPATKTVAATAATEQPAPQQGGGQAATKALAELKAIVAAQGEIITAQNEAIARILEHVSDINLHVRALCYNNTASEVLEDEETRESLRGIGYPGNA